MGEMMYIQILKLGMKGSLGKHALQEKIHRINLRKQKYKRSTNNSHKKFICVARKLLFKLCNCRERELFEKEFEAYQNSRVYYFVILAHVKIRMNEIERGNYKRNLTTLLQAKMQAYNEQITRANNKNFINFRFEEIADIEFAIKALSLYLEDRVEEAIEVIYKKEKGFVLKKQQYEMAIHIVAALEKKLRAFPEGELFPYLMERREEEGEGKEGRERAVRGKREDDEEWVQEMWQQQHSRHIIKREKRKETVYNSRAINTKNPLLFLEHSYNVNPLFYSIVFNYQDPQYPNPNPLPTHNPFNFAPMASPFASNQQSEKGKDIIKKEGELKGSGVVKSEQGVNYLYGTKGEDKLGVAATAADAGSAWCN